MRQKASWITTLRNDAGIQRAPQDAGRQVWMHHVVIKFDLAIHDDLSVSVQRVERGIILRVLLQLQPALLGGGRKRIILLVRG